MNKILALLSLNEDLTMKEIDVYNKKLRVGHITTEIRQMV